VPILPVSSGSACSRKLKSPFRPLGRLCLTLVLILLCSLVPPAWSQQGPNTITAIRVIGNRRIPKETVLARLFSRVNEAFDPATVERDFNSLWNTGYFEDVRIEREDTPQGITLDIFVREKPTINEINYKGLSTVPQSDVLDAFKKTKVGLSVQSQYDPTKVARAVTILRELLAAHGHQFSTVKTDVKTIPPASVSITFTLSSNLTVAFSVSWTAVESSSTFSGLK